MTASRLHLVRHGEVANPDGLLYGRLPGFTLSAKGVQTARAAADHLVAEGRTVTRVISSPLERAVQSAEPIAAAYRLGIEIREGLLEATSLLEGGQYRMDLSILGKPAAWRYLMNPMRPSWGEPFKDVARRVLTEMDKVRESVASGDVVMVSHQLPIWMAHRAVTGQRLFHDPRKRRCTLSSITSFELAGDRWREVEYAEPARGLGLRDVGAV
ncbi:histidine phosphatase family protein [Herbiconiux sp. L3-i23]|uniref:histidine phosphatase family protein n=1 Tax=Herbiconiux sp. L3-i23 TaxID=2905871 RepID=UPI00207084FB|nr:histidine phosphatase family protein [Herbiconiux sp. L3-i23]BDI21610.1 histidine phosphatase family protein [Herbiconiux sp. L3-i23]